MNTKQPAKMLVPTEVEPLAGYRMWIRFSDGVEGEIDIFPYLAESSWGLEEEERLFEDKVAIAPWELLVWEGKVGIFPTRLYQQVVKKIKLIFRIQCKMSRSSHRTLQLLFLPDLEHHWR